MATLPVGQSQIRQDLDLGQYCKLDEIPDSAERKCKIVCTMGPNQGTVDALVNIINAGMNIARLNFSHGDHATHGAMVDRIREASKKAGKPVGILLDTKGPEIRTGFFKAGGKIELKQGQDLKLVTDYSFKGDNTCFALSYPKLCTSVKPGNIILCADGGLSLKVKAVGNDFVMTEVMNNFQMGERKNCNLPGVKVDLPVLQDKDIDDLVNFGLKYQVDFCAPSFVQSAEDVQIVKKTFGERGRNIKIIPKIENEEGLLNFDAILDECDGIMVARGDLGMEIPPENVFLAQKMMISKCNAKGKPVITATQMLESMCGAPRPTRAEASDVANAVLDGTDCVMLSGETAAGGFPLEAVTIMRKICFTAEKIIEYRNLYLSLRLKSLKAGKMTAVQALCSSAVKASIDSKCKLIVCLTETGSTAKVLAQYRPQATILAVTASDVVQRQLQYVRGVQAIVTGSFVGTDAVLGKALDAAKDMGLVVKDDVVVAVHGAKEECPGGTSLMKLLTVGTHVL